MDKKGLQGWPGLALEAMPTIAAGSGAVSSSAPEAQLLLPAPLSFHSPFPSLVFPLKRDMAIAESVLSAPQVDAKEVPGAAASAPARYQADRSSCRILSPLSMNFPRKKG